MRLTVSLPKPPSANMLYANAGKSRVKSERYKAWIAHAGYELNLQTAGAPQVTGPVIIAITVNKETGDLANYEKAAVDLLVRHSLIEDDRNVVELLMRHDKSATDATVTVWQAEAAKASAA